MGPPTSTSNFDPDALLKPLSQHNYPKLRFWRKQDWIGSKELETTEIHNKMGLRGKSRISTGENVSFGFVEDENGLTVNGFRISEITSVMREIWMELYDRNMAPVTWGKGSSTVRNFYRTEMYKRIRELRYCENHWKVDYFATVNYSGWYRQHVVKDIKPKTEEDASMNRDDSDDYMHLPQKRLPTNPAAPLKKFKKLKIPIPEKPRSKTPDSVLSISTSPGSITQDFSSDSTPSTSPINSSTPLPSVPNPSAISSSCESQAADMQHPKLDKEDKGMS